MRKNIFFGAKGTARPLSTIVQVLIVCLLIVGAMFFIYFSIIPFISEFETPEIFQGVIISSDGGMCEVITDDELAPTKLMTNCYLKNATSVSVSYQKGLPYATIIPEK